jgi:uncharacterized repeat protein (TIGR03943 family)
MRRETQNILLVLLGGALLKISFTGTYLRYVKPSHQWLLITAGAIMVGLAAVSIARDLINARQAEVAGHEGHRHSSTSAWLLLLPVLAVFLVAPPALGASSVQGAGSTNRASAAQEDGTALFPPLQAGDVVAVPLSDFASRAAWDRGNSLNDRAVKLTGFVVHDGAASYVARLVIACCAADAFPVKVKLDSPQVTALPDDTWVEAVVTVEPGTATRENEFVPSATVGDVRQIPQPEDPYEH